MSDNERPFLTESAINILVTYYEYTREENAEPITSYDLIKLPRIFTGITYTRSLCSELFKQGLLNREDIPSDNGGRARVGYTISTRGTHILETYYALEKRLKEVPPPKETETVFSDSPVKTEILNQIDDSQRLKTHEAIQDKKVTSIPMQRDSNPPVADKDAPLSTKKIVPVSENYRKGYREGFNDGFQQAVKLYQMGQLRTI